jgi:hypothetical protein
MRATSLIALAESMTRSSPWNYNRPRLAVSSVVSHFASELIAIFGQKIQTETLPSLLRTCLRGFRDRRSNVGRTDDPLEGRCRLIGSGEIIGLQAGELSSVGGGRTQAAKATSQFGLVIKVSEDGPISVYSKGTKVLRLIC